MRFTVVADLLGDHFFNAPQISKPENILALENGVKTTLTSVVQESDSLDVDNFMVGSKFNPVGLAFAGVDSLAVGAFDAFKFG